MTEHRLELEPGGRPEPAGRFAPVSQRKPHVLIAEDDSEFRCLLAGAFTEAGFAVSECSDGSRLFITTADSILDRTKPKVDLIVSDVRMPGYTGIEFLSRLHEFRWNIPIILITAFGDPDTHAKALRMGVFAVLDKPFDIERLVRTARHALAGIAFGRYFTDTFKE
jgi:DNA-binding NtrC family response regulator